MKPIMRQTSVVNSRYPPGALTIRDNFLIFPNLSSLLNIAHNHIISVEANIQVIQVFQNFLLTQAPHFQVYLIDFIISFYCGLKSVRVRKF